MRDIFKLSFEFCKEYVKKIEQPSSVNTTSYTSSNKGQRAASHKSSQGRNSNSKNTDNSDSLMIDNVTNKKPPLFIMKDEIAFAKLVVD